MLQPSSGVPDGSRMVHVMLNPGLLRRLRTVVGAKYTSVQVWLVRIVEHALIVHRSNSAKKGDLV